MAKQNKISIEIDLDEQQIPESIRWVNGSDEKIQEVKALIISLFDKETKDTLKLDLWTKEMQVIEMDRFIFHSINAMADTYVRATNNTALGEAMRHFANYFGQQTEILENKEEN